MIARLLAIACLLVFAPIGAAGQTVQCEADSWASDRICADAELGVLNDRLTARLHQLLNATPKKTLHSLIETAQSDWAETLDTCRSAGDPNITVAFLTEF